jgi:dTDP-4-amino-4,6-dideoxygalactose transaminase
MINLFKVSMNPNISQELTPILLSGFITQGNKVEEFEEKLQEKFNHKYLLTLNSATSGLTLAIRLLKNKDINWPGINDNDYVLSTPLTCFATNASILANNLKIKWIDIDKETCNIDLDDLEKKINKNTKIIVFVHWGGNSIDYDKLNLILNKKELELGFRPTVIEDCAHAMMSKFDNKYIGTHGNISVFSLQAIKHLTTGDGGLIFLPNEELYNRAKLLRWYGIDRDKRNYKKKDLRMENDIEEWGYKYHMNDISATIGISNLELLDDNVEIIKKNCRYYKDNLQNLQKIKLLKLNKKADCCYWIYTILCDDVEKFVNFMKDNNIMVSQVHKRNDIHTCTKDFIINLPNLNEIENKYVCIPCGWWLNNKDIIYIVNSIKEYDNI